VGEKAVVGFPNFAYWKMRMYLLLWGRMPKTEFLPYEWYDTPNIHFCSVADFEEYCRKFAVAGGAARLPLQRPGGEGAARRPYQACRAESAVYLLSKK